MNPDVEEQYILRLPPALADKMRSAIRKGKQDLGMELHMDDAQNGELRMGDERHRLVVAELPTIVESQKTLNNSTYYKSADIHQMLVVLEPGQDLPKGAEADLSMKHGLTPPTRNSRRRFTRHKTKINLTAVETELLKIMRRNALFDNGTERIELIEGDEYEDEVEQPAGGGAAQGAGDATSEKDASDHEGASDDSERKTKKKKKHKNADDKSKEGGAKEAKDGKEKKRKKEKKKKAAADTPQPTPTPQPIPRLVIRTVAPAAAPTPAGPVSPVAPLQTPAAALSSSTISVPSPLPMPEFSTPAPAPAPTPAPAAVAPLPLPLPLSLADSSADLFVPELRIAQLQEEQRQTLAEISALRARLADAQAKAASSANPVMRMRYEAAVQEAYAQLAGRTNRIAQLRDEIARIGGSS